MKLFFDTETTGKCHFRLPIGHHSQPRIVQLGALLCEDNGDERGVLDVIIAPDGWEIPEEASAIHGITTPIASSCGVLISHVLSVLRCMMQSADTIIAHNIDFDILVLAGELLRDGNRWTLPTSRFCTMRAMTPVCRIPGNYGDYKWPKLTEAHRHMFGADIEGAHNAMADVRACAKIYFELTKETK